MLLAIDVGNTHTVVGLFDGETLTSDWRITTSATQTIDELSVLYRVLLDGAGHRLQSLDGMAVSSVVPSLTAEYRSIGERDFGGAPLIIDHRVIPYLPVLNHDPASVGADRLVNAVAAIENYGKPAVVVDLGTATTLDVIDGDGAYAGGVIVPGIATSATALFQKGARLARVEIARPERVVGRSTEESIQSGVFFGAVGAVDALVDQVVEEMGFPAGLPVVATGGLASNIATSSRTITHVDTTLTLQGIRLIWERAR